MATVLTAKQILLGYDITSPTDEKGKSYRGTAFEFQDYAYRLACDLNDLEHLAIYMRLTKQYPRHLLDRTYESIADINEFNKGKLFMWKFKKVRAELQKNKDLKNYDYAHVIEKMKKTRNELINSITRKHNDIEKNKLVQFMTEFKEDFSEEVSKVLILGLTSTLLISMFASNNRKIYGIEISKNITNQAKKEFGKQKRRFFITKDFLQNTYKLHQFDLIVFSSFWEMIPLESESDYLKQIQRILKPNGKLYLSANISGQDQSFKIINKEEQEYFFFNKSNNKQDLENSFMQNGFNILKNNIDDDVSVYRLEHSL
ncbi:class I SAM-dependent methyltransferase [Candidatus Dojkabacteria bacterium]|uniref:Class I SAM-dependent methyltransferase n=1 Tax=Candidatus Dojkabacteria bacterium TaxID=2099670 RepID=A0A955RH12_9BACT|nr:class I SAM-dependent methyltransferase [Candidatus Dojkabacteria bacterium]